MVEVTEADKQMVADYLAAISINMPNLAALILANESALARCFAAHREAAVKAERDRLLNWAANNFLAEGNYTGALVVHKLARALEQNP